MIDIKDITMIAQTYHISTVKDIKPLKSSLVRAYYCYNSCLVFQWRTAKSSGFQDASLNVPLWSVIHTCNGLWFRHFFHWYESIFLQHYCFIFSSSILYQDNNSMGWLPSNSDYMRLATWGLAVLSPPIVVDQKMLETNATNPSEF